MTCPECGRDIPIRYPDDAVSAYFTAHGDLRKPMAATVSGRRYQPTCAASGRLVLRTQPHQTNQERSGNAS